MLDYLKIKELIINNNLQTFITYHNKKLINIEKIGFNPLLYACEQNAWDIAEYIVSVTDYWTNKSDEYGNTALIYAFINNKFDFATMLIDYGFTNFSQRNDEGYLAMNYIIDNDRISKHILDIILRKTKSSEKSIDEFKIFNSDDMDLKQMDAHGGYGSLIYDKKSGNIIKINNKENIIPSLIKELMMVRFINGININLTGIIKGICFIENKLGLVYESLNYSLQDVFDIYNKIDIKNKREYFKMIFHTLLESIDKIHNLGILHRDLKPSNVMIDNDGHIKIIDFGIAEYVGVKNKNLKFIGTNNYIAPDSGTLEYLRLNLERIKLPNNMRNYSSDIFSYGSIILYALFGENFCLFFFEDNIYEYKQTGDNKNILLTPMSTKRIDIINSFSPHLMNLLKNAFEIDSNYRMTAKELLLSPFFDDIENSHLKEKISFCEQICKTQISEINNPEFSTDDIRLNRSVLKYGPEIYDFIKTQIIPPTNVDDYTLEIIKKFWENHRYGIDNFDVAFNRNIKLTSVDYNGNVGSDDIYKIFFTGARPEYNEELKSTIKSLAPKLNIVQPISIISLIEYYVTVLQNNNIISSIINYFREVAYKSFYEYSLQKRDLPITVESFMNLILKEVSGDKETPLPII